MEHGSPLAISLLGQFEPLLDLFRDLWISFPVLFVIRNTGVTGVGLFVTPDA